MSEKAPIPPTALAAPTSGVVVHPLPSVSASQPEPSVAAAQGLRVASVSPLASRSADPFEGLVSALRRRTPQTCELVLLRLTQRLPSAEADGALTGAHLVGFLLDSLESQLRAFAREELPDGAASVDAEAARAVSRSGELSLLLGAYRAMQAILWETWFGLVEDSDLAPSERRQLLSRGSDFFFRYADLLSDCVAGVYQSELERSSCNGEGRRFQAIRSVLEGDSPDRVGNALDFDLDRHHLGLLAWGEGADDALRRLAASLERPLLLTGPGPDLRWAWISGARAFDPGEERSLARFPSPAGIAISVGLPAFGPDGFRATHRQAVRARRFASEDRPALLRYEDIVVEALAGENFDDARAFVDHELHGIDDASQTSQRLRDTLQAYFDSEYNAASAAATLGVHQQTVANRLRAIEERLGQRSIGVRRVELEIALRLRSCLVPEHAA